MVGANYDLVRSEPTEVMDAQYQQVDKLKEVPGESNRNPQLEQAIFRYVDIEKSKLSGNNYYSYSNPK
jgi:hypothetical protein